MGEKIIKIRRGLNGFPYAAYSEKGIFIANFKKLADAREHWKWEINHGMVKLIRELGRQKDETTNN